MVLRASPVRCLRTVAGGDAQLFHGTPLLGNRYGRKAAGKHQPRNEGCAPGGTIFRDPGGCPPRSGEDGIQTDAGIEWPPLTISLVLAEVRLDFRKLGELHIQFVLQRERLAATAARGRSAALSRR